MFHKTTKYDFYTEEKYSIGSLGGEKWLEISEKWIEHFFSEDLTARPTLMEIQRGEKERKEILFLGQYVSDIIEHLWQLLLCLHVLQ